MGYDETVPPEDQYTAGQLAHCKLQCKALLDYFQVIVLQNDGDATHGWTQEECAHYAASRTFGKVVPSLAMLTSQATAQTVQKWYSHNYVLNDGCLRPRESGKYERDTFTEWFMLQDDLRIRLLKEPVSSTSPCGFNRQTRTEPSCVLTLTLTQYTGGV